MNKNVADPAQAYRGLIAGYTDAIRASDFKANIAILFVAFMMGPVLGNYTNFPKSAHSLRHAAVPDRVPVPVRSAHPALSQARR